MKLDMTLANAVENFVALATDRVHTRYKETFPNLVDENGNPDWLLVANPGRKYVKLIEGPADGSSRSVFGFIDAETGDILKAASWRKPAKHARGNIFDDDKGVSALTATGSIRYL